jgi:glycosyltransferase involved in cell wall biosynthesis
MLRIAVVTPYYKETTAILRQCHDSVLNQTYPCQHILVSDGHPNGLFDNSETALHITLPNASADNGNTPRAMGRIFAEQRGFDAVAYLDADNWFDPIHIETLVAAQEMSCSPIAASRRKFCDLDGAPPGCPRKR